jgi:hypothetical protein
VSVERHVSANDLAAAIIGGLGGALACAGMILALPRDTWIRLVVWTVIGFLIYGFYGRRSSRQKREAVS